MQRLLATINLASVILLVGINYLSQTLRFNNTTIVETSDSYENLFTPASYAFGIWGLIFISLFAFSVFQVYRVFFTYNKNEFIHKISYWFAAVNLFNCLWLFAFIYDFIGLSVILILIILFALVKIILRLNMERWDAPLWTIAFVWWPICLYSGWISVATIANIASYLTKLGWEGGILSPEVWTIIMIVIATVLNIFMVLKRNMREFAMVGVWALVAIFIRHKEGYLAIAVMAMLNAIIIFCVIGWHGYKNRHTSPLQKLKNKN